MFNQFSGPAQRAVERAQKEASSRGEKVGPEHLLVGILGEEASMAAQVLQRLGVTIELVLSRLEPSNPSSLRVGTKPQQFTGRSLTVFELALRESVSQWQDEVSTEHLLMGIVRETLGRPHDIGVVTRIFAKTRLASDTGSQHCQDTLRQLVSSRGRQSQQSPA